MSVHSCLSVLLSLSHIVYICTVLFEQINNDDDDDDLGLSRSRVRLPAVPVCGNNIRQVVHTRVRQSPSDIIRYRSTGTSSGVLRLGR